MAVDTGSVHNMLTLYDPKAFNSIQCSNQSNINFPRNHSSQKLALIMKEGCNVIDNFLF
jgi:hypothetical protein